MHRISVNGIASDYIAATDRGLAYGDGVFETLVCINGRLPFWQQHMDRLRIGADRLGIACPTSELFLSDIEALCMEQPSDNDFVIKLLLSRGSGGRGYAFARDQQPTRMVMLFDLDNQQHSPEKINVCVCRHRLPVNSTLAGIKHLNRLDNVLARNEWGREYFEGLMLDTCDNVIEGTMSNLFGVRDNQLYTPALEQCGVHGIIRDQVIAIAHEHAIKLNITNLSLQDIKNMDALFLCNSIIKIVPVASLQDKCFNNNDITQFIIEQLDQRAASHAQTIS